MKILKGNRGLYLPSRGLATTLSLLFALIYTQDLGVINRSYVAVIMTFSVLIIVFMTSGTTLTLRNLSTSAKTTENISSFISLVVIEGAAGLFLFFLALISFSILKDPLPQPLIFISLLYFIFSALHLILMEVLLAYKNFAQAGKYEILTIIFQILFYYFSGLIPALSIASRLFLSFSASYAIIIVLSYLLVRPHFSHIRKLVSPRVFFEQSKGNHSIGTVLGIIDRLDRLVIAWFLPITYLGKYTVMSSFISFFRFIPDSLSKLMISSKSRVLGNFLKNPKLLFLGVAGLIAIIITVSQILISNILGTEWLLPWSISLIFALQELARGAFQLAGNYKVSVGSSSQTHIAALILLFTAGPLAIALSYWQGIIGVPLGFFISYSGLLLYLRRRGKLV